MNDFEYWQERSEQNIILTEQLANSYNEQLAREYNKVIKSLQQQLYEFYALYASENGLTLQEAQKKLSSKELKELSQTAATEELETKKKIQSKFPDGWKDMYMQLDEQGKQVFWKSIVKEIKISPNEFVEDIIFF